MKLYMFRTVPVSIIRCLFTVYSAMVYVIQDYQTAFEQDQDVNAVPSWSCLQTCMTYTTAECTLNKLLMMDTRTVRNM